MNIKRLFPIFTVLTLLVLPACFSNNDYSSDYSEWRQLNQDYIDRIATLTENGQLVYTPLTPKWDNSFTIYMQRVNEERNNNEITPLSSSTCIVKYTLTNISGDTLDSSASYVCKPNAMITGFMAALTNMRVNDTVNVVIPYTAGYGVYGYSDVLPYSTLIFGIRLDSIVRLM